MAYRTIHGNGPFERTEGLASGTPSPGHLAELTSATADTYKVQTANGPKAPAAVFVEDDLQGKDIDDAYTAATIAQVNLYPPGSAAVLRVKNGENISKGDLVCSAGSGEVRKVVSDSSATVVEDIPIAIALVGCDMSDSSSVDPDPYCLCRFI
jgi:hypothetical protein